MKLCVKHAPLKSGNTTGVLEVLREKKEGDDGSWSSNALWSSSLYGTYYSCVVRRLKTDFGMGPLELRFVGTTNNWVCCDITSVVSS